MMRMILLALPLLMCAACNKAPSVSVDNASAEEVGKKLKETGVAEALMTPGKWQYQMTLINMSAPNMPPEAAARMKEMMATPMISERCVTAEDAKKIDAAMGEVPKNCTFNHYEIGGGKIAGEMTCTNAGVTQKTKMSGTYTLDSSEVTATSTTSGRPAPMGDMTMTMNMKGKRVGDCSAGAAQPK